MQVIIHHVTPDDGRSNALPRQSPRSQLLSGLYPLLRKSFPASVLFSELKKGQPDGDYGRGLMNSD